MKKSIIGVVIALIVIGGIAAATMTNKPAKTTNTSTTPTTPAPATTPSQNPVNNQTTTTNTEVPAATANVTIKNSAYTPAQITVKVGTKVTWTQEDSLRHDVAPDNSSSDFTGSELLSKGESYSFTFTKAGTYSYHCTPHPFMKGTVTVTE